VARVATRAEELGYHSLWTFQRLLVGQDQDLLPVYRSVLDPLLTLTWAAARTTRIRLGVAVVNLPFVSPAYLAKQASTLDILSNGRFDLGLGTGWSDVEYAASGVTQAGRGKRADEYLAALRTLFNDEISAYDGDFYHVPPSRMDPRPVQPGGPPVLVGGSADSALRRAGALGAGWLSGSTESLAGITRAAPIVRQAAADAGRDPAQVRIVCRGMVTVGEQRPDQPLSGSYAQIRAGAELLAERGVTELFYDLNWDPAIGSPDADPAAALDRAEELLSALAP
jgi:probable F420-dependent oxidoreductase